MMNTMPDAVFRATDERPLHFYYEYTFMPEGLLNRLSVRLHDKIAGEDGDKVWSDGVVFQKDDLIAEVRELRQPDTSRIDIKITGKAAHWMSEYLILEIDKINTDFNLERLKVTVNIPCICEACLKNDTPHFYDLKRIKGDLQKDNTDFHSIQCPDSRKTINLHGLLKLISPKVLKEIEKIHKEKKIGRFGIAMEERFDEVIDKIEVAHKETQQYISEEFAKIPQIFRDNILERDKQLLSDLFDKMKTARFDETAGTELIEEINKAVMAAFQKQPSQEDLLMAFQRMMMLPKESGDMKHKLKVSLPLIPTILKYEAEVNAEEILEDIRSSRFFQFLRRVVL